MISLEIFCYFVNSCSYYWFFFYYAALSFVLLSIDKEANFFWLSLRSVIIFSAYLSSSEHLIYFGTTNFFCIILSPCSLFSRLLSYLLSYSAFDSLVFTSGSKSLHSSSTNASLYWSCIAFLTLRWTRACIWFDVAILCMVLALSSYFCSFLTAFQVWASTALASFSFSKATSMAFFILNSFRNF